MIALDARVVMLTFATVNLNKLANWTWQSSKVKYKLTLKRVFYLY